MSKKNERSSINEVHLVIMRLLSVFMSRTKSGSKSSSEVYIIFCDRIFPWTVFYFFSCFFKTKLPVYAVLHARCTLFLSSSHPRLFQTPQRLPCSASVLLTTVSTCSNLSWSSGKANRVKKSRWPPASSSAPTQPPLPQT